MRIQSKLAAVVATSAMAFVPLSGAVPELQGTPARAAAETNCGMTIPSTVRIASASDTTLEIRLSPYCLDVGVVTAYWYGWMGSPVSENVGDEIDFDYSPGNHAWPWITWSNGWSVHRLGVETWWPIEAFDKNNNGVQQRKSYTTWKVGEKAAISTSRSGSYVTIKTSSAYFSQYYATWATWRHVTGMIQYYGAHGWTNLKYAYQDANGHYTYKLHAPTKRSYRLTLPTTSTAWGTASTSSYR